MIQFLIGILIGMFFICLVGVIPLESNIESEKNFIHGKSTYQCKKQMN